MPKRSDFQTEAEWLYHLRIWFAGKAMTIAHVTYAAGRIKDERRPDAVNLGYEDTVDADIIAEYACSLADAMLAALPGGGKERWFTPDTGEDDAPEMNIAYSCRFGGQYGDGVSFDNGNATTESPGTIPELLADGWVEIDPATGIHLKGASNAD